MRRWLSVAVFIVVLAAISAFLLTRPTTARNSTRQGGDDGGTASARTQVGNMDDERRQAQSAGGTASAASASRGVEENGTKPAVATPKAESVADPVMPQEYASLKPLKPDTNPTVKQVAEAAKAGKPDFTSPNAQIPPFDPQAYAANPAAYCAASIPARVFQTATPGEGVPALVAVGAPTRSLSLGGSCELSVRTTPGAPTTFVTYDLGSFPNGLTAITVQANSDGVAMTTFTATAGTIGPVSVLAGSPTASGQAPFDITVFGNDQPRISDNAKNPQQIKAQP